MRNRLHIVLASALASVLAALLCLAPIAEAQRTHTVRAGQSLSRIARRYGVSVSDLLSANGLDRDDPIRPGMELVIPEEGIVYVRSGQTLASIARAHDCSVAELRRINHLSEGATLHVGDRIVLCGFDDLASSGRHGRRASSSSSSSDEDSRWGTPRSRGVVTFYRHSTRVTTRIRIVDRSGHATKRGRRRLRDVMRPDGWRRSTPTPSSRFVELIARISNHFGGRRITVISGYRTAGGDTRESSRHTHGLAMDMRISGVPNTVLRDYVRGIARTGVGFYPRSHFVHVDVRDRSAYWVDWSRPGEHPRYMRRGDAPPDDATADELRAVGAGGDDEGEDDSGAGGEAAGDTGADAPEVAPDVEDDAEDDDD